MSIGLGNYPEIGLAFPFRNLAFDIWRETDNPADWDDANAGSQTGTLSKHNPGFGITRAIKIVDTGVITSPCYNGIENEISLPDYVPNGQLWRIGYCCQSDLSGQGASQAVIIVSDNTGNLIYKHTDEQASWKIEEHSDGTGIRSANADLRIHIEARSYNSEANPGVLYDCIAIEHGLTAASRYYTFTVKPDFNGCRMFPQFFDQDGRMANGRLRSWDPSDGAVKWKVIMPFENVPGSFVESIMEFIERNKGLGGNTATPLVLRPMQHDPTYNTGDEYLRRPPWIICNCMNKGEIFKPSGGWMGADLFSGTLEFEEI